MCKSKLTFHGNVTSQEIPRFVEITTRLVGIIISTQNFGILHTKYLMLPCVYRNEVITEQYHYINGILFVMQFFMISLETIRTLVQTNNAFGNKIFGLS